ncbi:MAG TPA: DNA polymerase III subunit delta, partial [Gammaproteobacteria bacterium]|nr:DNA polymerase III subunit delta [Gammaproteobacteria bacterium]
MKLAPRQLEHHLKKQLAPIYLLSGDEPLQMMEAADLLRKVAAEKGYSERQIIHAEAGFDWSVLRAEAAAMSLFSERKVLDLRLRSGKPGRDGSKALVQYASRSPEDNVLLIQTGKLDRSAMNSAWVKALDKAGVVIQIWELSPPETLNFVTQRLQAAGFIPDREAARLLTERVEGNLLAAVQEVEKL